jgi:hypothetical protein
VRAGFRLSAFACDVLEALVQILARTRRERARVAVCVEDVGHLARTVRTRDLLQDPAVRLDDLKRVRLKCGVATFAGAGSGRDIFTFDRATPIDPWSPVDLVNRRSSTFRGWSLQIRKQPKKPFSL